MTHRLRSLLACAVAFAVPLATYVASLDPGVDYWDTGELQTVPYILGIAHPSGFPAYVLLGWLWSHVVPFGDPAYRMNLLSAFGMATASATIAACALELGATPVLAAGAALVFATTRVPWGHATHADVHALALAAIGLGFWAALHWRRTGSRRALAGAAVATGFALGIHSGTILIAPGIALGALGRRPGWRRAAAALATTVALATVAYAYLPLRSAVVFAQRLDPTLALGIAPGRPFWDADHPSTWQGFVTEVGGGDFGTGSALARLGDPRVLTSLPKTFGETAVGDLAGGVLLIALAGIVTTARRLPLAAIGLVAGALLPVLFVLAYPAESDPERYYLPAYWTIGVFVAVGAEILARGGLARAPRSVALLLGTVFAAVALGNGWAGRGAFQARGGYNSAEPFIARVLESTPSNAVLVVPWMYATPLAYAAYVEHRLGRRIVVTGWPEDFTNDYGRWLLARPVVFVSDDPTIAVRDLRIVEPDPLTPAPHFFTAHALL